MMAATPKIDSNAKPLVIKRWLKTCATYPVIPGNGHSRRALELKEIVNDIAGVQFGYSLDEAQAPHLSLAWICSDTALVVDRLCLFMGVFFLCDNTVEFGGYPCCFWFIIANNGPFYLAHIDVSSYGHHRWSMVGYPVVDGNSQLAYSRICVVPI